MSTIIFKIQNKMHRINYISLFFADQLQGFFALYSWTKGKFRAISKRQSWDVQSFAIDHPPNHKRRWIFYTTNEGGFTRLYGVDAKSGLPLKLPSFPGADHVVAGVFSPSGDSIMIGVAMPNAAVASYVYNINSHQLVQWVVPSSPEVDLAKFAPATLEYYPARDGTQIPMFVRRPQSCRGQLCPVIVSFHSGPEAQAYPGLNPTLQLFVDEGYVVVEPNMRGSLGYGRAWLNADNGAKRLNVLSDIEDLGRFIKNNWKVGGVSPKVGARGAGYGGYAVNAAMTLFAGTFDAGSANSGMTNLLTFVSSSSGSRYALRVAEYGDPEIDRETLEKLSPIFAVDKIKDPLQLVDSPNDPRSLIVDGMKMMASMKAKNIPGELIVDDGRVSGIGHELMFFRKVLVTTSAAPPAAIQKENQREK